MFIKIPFESEIVFKTNISEITKMSLEHDYNVNDGVVLGNFYVSGEYKTHEVSINKEPFKYTLPFTVELREDIIKDTLEFNVEDFSYDIINDNTLKVNIEYSLNADVRKEDDEVFERVDESELADEMNYIDEFLEKVDNEYATDNEKTRDEKVEIKEEVKEEAKEEVKEDTNATNEEKNEEEERISKEEEKTIMETIKDSDDTFVTYHVHIVKESETIESICSMYNVSSALVNEYNTIDTINVGDKILIPKADE